MYIRKKKLHNIQWELKLSWRPIQAIKGDFMAIRRGDFLFIGNQRRALSAWATFLGDVSLELGLSEGKWYFFK